MSKPKKEKTFVGVKLTAELHAKIKAMAAKGMRSLSQELTMAVKEHVGESTAA